MNSKNLVAPAAPPRARLLAALDGRVTDHVPVWLLFPYHPTSYYVDVHNLPACQPVLDEARGKRFILSPTAGPFDPDVPKQVIRNYQVLMRTAWEYDWNR